MGGRGTVDLDELAQVPRICEPDSGGQGHLESDVSSSRDVTLLAGHPVNRMLTAIVQA